MTLTFLNPEAGWLLLALPLLWWPMRARPRWRPLALRAATFACLIAALAQPSLVRRNGAGVAVVILDQRAILGPEGRAAARRAYARIEAASPRDAQRLLVQLGGETGGDAATGAARRMVRDGSLSTALAEALDAIPLGTGGSVTLIGSDRSTDRHWADAVAALTARRIPVDTITVAPGPRRAFIADVSAAPARVGESIRVDTTVEGDGDGPHRIAILGGSKPLAVSAPFQADGVVHVVLEVPAEAAGFLPLRVVLDGRDGFDTVAAVQDPLRLLYLGERQAGAAAALQRLLGRGVAVDAQPPAALATRIDPARWPVVMLDDVPAARLSPGAQAALLRAVARDGTGLFASGGMAAFGGGGYADAPLGAALPVTARQQERRVRPSIALAVVIDSSGSMQGDRLELAKQVARQTVRKLTPNDWVGVVEFYGARQWSVPMHHATDIPDVERAIGRMRADGSSVLFPALQEAFYGLMDVEARYRHILVISDGGVAEDRYRQLLRHIADNRINVSTVAVGGQPDDEQSMAQWAQIGHGRFYSVADEFGLVDLDFRQPQTRPDPPYRQGRVAVRASGDAAWWSGMAAGAMPPLSGYVPTRLRPEAEALLRTDGGDPVLASWQVGSGRVTALTTEPFGAGTADWRRWSGYGRWLARVLAQTARARPDWNVALDRRGGVLRIAAQRLSPAGADAMPDMRLVDAGGRPIHRVDAVEERAPGLFVADVPVPRDVPARVEVRDGTRIARAADAAGSDVRAEDAMPAAMALPFAALSQATGGWHRDDPASPPGEPHRVRGWRATDLWPWLALAALALYLFDVAYRRWPRRRNSGMP